MTGSRFTRACIRAAVACMLLIAPAFTTAVAQTSPVTPSSIEAHHRAFDLYRAGKAAEALPIAIGAVREFERTKGPDHRDLGEALNTLGLIQWSLARYGDAEPTYRRAIAIAEHNGQNDWTLGARINNLGILHAAQGRYDDAEQTYKRAMAVAERVFPPTHAEIARVLANLSNVLIVQGRLAEAETAAERALRIREAAHGLMHVDVGHSLFTLSEVYRLQDRTSESEPLVKRALAIEETVSGSSHPNMVSRLNNLAEAYRTDGRLDEAEPLYRRAMEIAGQVGNDHFMIYMLNNLGWVYWATGRQEQAEQSLVRALALAERLFGASHATLLTMLHNLAAVYRVQGRAGEAEATIRRALSIGEQNGNRHPHIAKALNNLGLLQQAGGSRAEAKATFERAIEQVARTLGPEHPDNAIFLGNLGALLAEQAEWAQAAAALRRAAEISTNRTRRLTTRLGRPLASTTAGEAIRPSERHALLLKVLDRLSRLPGADRTSLEAEMFVAAQHVRGSQAAVSLGQMAARQAKGDGALAQLVRERQDLVSEWQGRDKLLTSAVAQPPNARNAGSEALLRQRLAAIDGRLAEIDTALAARFPEYARYLSPEPMTISQAQALLRADEAMVITVDTSEAKGMPEETFVWVLTRSEYRRVRAVVGSAGLQREVAALRCGLDESAWRNADGPLACPALLGLPPADGVPLTLPFEADRAHALYKSLFTGVEDMLQDRSLLIVPSGPLQALPWQVLVRRAPADKSDFAHAEWMIAQHAMTVLPAVSSLAALRSHARPAPAADPYLGFANPLLTGSSGTARGAFARQACTVPGGSPTQLVASAGRTAPPVVARRAEIDVEGLRRQPPLPETADEVCLVARAQGIARPDDAVYLGERATEARVKAMSRDGSLARVRVVHFATHGLLPRETASLAAMSEPALLLTPPAAPTAEDDGLLTASEVTTLRLDADWVILSACNTAGAGEDGSDALSGLARAFFYAGARSLLASHWYVDSDATVELVTKAFEAIRLSPERGRAEALRAAMAGMIAGGGRRGHPSSWAPFVLVGEGGAVGR